MLHVWWHPFTKVIHKWYNTSFVPAPIIPLLPVPFRSLYNFVSYSRSTEWNNTTVSNHSDPKGYTHCPKNKSMCIPVKLLSSQSCSPLTVPKRHPVMYGDKSFRASAPKLWINLLNHIKLLTSKNKYFVRLLKHSYLNYPIYTVYKPVYLCIKCIFAIWA